MDKFQKSIVISPIEEFSPVLLNMLGKHISNTFDCQTMIIPMLSDITFAYNAERDQYHSTQIIEKFSEIAPLHTLKVIALTTVDLFIPILTYVFGEAQLNGKACILSVNRLDGPLSLLNERIVKEAVHELGHTFNLRHCQDSTCIMHYCRSEEDVDKKSEQFCRYCKVLVNDSLNMQKKSF